jgi:hypothetical protein
MNSCQANAAACASVALGAPPFDALSSFGTVDVMVIGTGSCACAAVEYAPRRTTVIGRAIRGRHDMGVLLVALDATFECFYLADANVNRR